MATKRYRSLVTGACTPAGRILVEGLSANGHFVVATDSPEAFGADDGRLADAARAVRDVADMVVPVDPATPGTMDPLLAGVNFVLLLIVRRRTLLPGKPATTSMSRALQT